jgi:predicted transcriptional regulator
MENKRLTSAEEEIMQVLWKLGKGFVKDIVAELPEPKPAYNTVSTIVRILESKGFVDHNAFGKTFEYFPVMDKATYSELYLKSFIDRYFGGSFSKMVSFFAKKQDIDLKEFEKLMKEMDKEL